MNQEFKEGSLEALTLVVSNIEGICADKLQWPQVIDIRKDEEALQKLRRFKWWMNDDMQGKELSEISNKIAAGISDYEFALKKHGVETQSGTWASIFDFRAILASVGVWKLLAPFGELISVGAPILVNIGTGVFEFRRRKILGEEFKRKNPEMAYVMELKKRCGTE